MGGQPTRVISLISRSEEETERLGAVLLELLPYPGVVALTGTLGAGKTRLVRAIAQAAGIDPAAVSSPTFVLLHEYEGERTIYHFDAYRLKNEEEFLQLGPEEYFAREGLCLIEWAERVENVLPKNHAEIRIEVLGETEREFLVRVGC